MIFVYRIPPGTTTRGLKQTRHGQRDWGCPLATPRICRPESEDSGGSIFRPPAEITCEGKSKKCNSHETRDDILNTCEKKTDRLSRRAGESTLLPNQRTKWVKKLLRDWIEKRNGKTEKNWLNEFALNPCVLNTMKINILIFSLGRYTHRTPIIIK